MSGFQHQQQLHQRTSITHNTGNSSSEPQSSGLGQRSDSSTPSHSSELSSKSAVVNQPVPNFNSYLPPSPPRSRSPSPYGLSGGSGFSDSTSSSSGPRLRMSTAATSTYLQPQHSSSDRSPSTSPISSSFISPSASSSAAAISTATATSQQRRPSQNGDVPRPYIAGSSQVEGVTTESRPNEYLHHVNVHHSAASPNGYANGHVNGYQYQQQQQPPPPPSMRNGNTPGHPSLATAPFINSIYSKANGIIKELPFSPLSPSGLPTHSSISSSSTHHLQPSSASSSFNRHNRRHSIAQAVTPSISTVRFVSLCALWYTSSALSSNTGKSIMNRFKYPVTLTFIQFGFVAGWCIIFGIGRTKFAQFSANKQNSRGGGGAGLHHHARALSVSQTHAASGWGIKKPTKKALEGTLVMSGFQIAGHIFSSMAIARVPVSTVHTIKVSHKRIDSLAHALCWRLHKLIFPTTRLSLLSSPSCHTASCSESATLTIPMYHCYRSHWE